LAQGLDDAGEEEEGAGTGLALATHTQRNRRVYWAQNDQDWEGNLHLLVRFQATDVEGFHIAGSMTLLDEHLQPRKE